MKLQDALLLSFLLFGYLMSLTEKLALSGEHPLSFRGAAGMLEAIITVPPQVNESYFALLGHPHSLQGGTMNNKVVTTMARAFKDLGIASLRFNFRGVGHSEGVYDDGIGESEDMLAFVRLWQQERPNTHFLYAGFSFGSYVAYRAAAQCSHDLLITVAPPVHHFDYQEFVPAPSPWLLLQGDEDEVVPLATVLNFLNDSSLPITMIRFKDTSHFFHGKLLELKATLIDSIRQVLVL